ncbi:hypothetical protein SG34_011345 [Thalassomonas viridans]|uniref:Uncharacterized protein n=1 Tax=Thalassomonas viridans TaxID=137584 RepID=A0AAF0CCJ0_9GAMM|nr:hypothetical protein [Thalassomonas viridans]WDE07424.1 hypothetical protein SG34_011345 [Thalassomonas viridans]
MKSGNKVLLAGILLTLCSHVSAKECRTQNSKLIPNWSKGGSQTITNIQFSNISDKAIDVHFKFYDINGNAYLESSEAGTNFSLWNIADPVTSYAQLGAGKSASVSISGGGGNIGHGVVYWQSTECITPPLTVTMIYDFRDSASNMSRSHVPLNNGNAF